MSKPKTLRVDTLESMVSYLIAHRRRHAARLAVDPDVSSKLRGLVESECQAMVFADADSGEIRAVLGHWDQSDQNIDPVTLALRCRPPSELTALKSISGKDMARRPFTDSLRRVLTSDMHHDLVSWSRQILLNVIVEDDTAVMSIYGCNDPFIADFQMVGKEGVFKFDVRIVVRAHVCPTGPSNSPALRFVLDVDSEAESNDPMAWRSAIEAFDWKDTATVIYGSNRTSITSDIIWDTEPALSWPRPCSIKAVR